MFYPLAFFIGLRYTRAKRRNHFISFISFTSLIGISLGIVVLITVLSVMNGFDQEIKKRVFGMVPAITIESPYGGIKDWQTVQPLLETVSGVTHTAPFVSGQSLLSHGGSVQPVLLQGIIPAEEKNVSYIGQKMLQGSLMALTPGSFGIALGEELAGHLGALLGDLVTVVTPQMSLSPAGVMPRFKRFTVAAIFRAGSGFGFDSALAFISLQDAQKLLGLGETVTGLHVAVQNIYAAPQMTTRLINLLAPSAQITNWTEQFGAFFHAIRMEKTMMFFILLLIIAVAAFNLVSMLVMVVNDKEADIAILRTFGATPRMIMAIFMVQGMMIGLVGTILGIVGGIALALHVTQVVYWIERLFHVELVSSSVYYVNYLPSQLQTQDVIHIGLAAFVLSMLATLYPAFRAARIEPAEALRYE